MPTEEEAELIALGYRSLEDFVARPNDRSSRQILDFPADQKPLDLSLAPAVISFGEWNPNTISTPQSAVLTNVGYEQMVLESIQVSGDFTITTDCPSTLRPGETCTITAYFAPTAPGLKTGTIYVNTLDAAGDEAVQLMGTGSVLDGLLTLTPPFLTFTDVVMLTDSAPQTVILRNTGQTTAPLLGLSVDGEFEMTHNCGSSLVPGGFCTLNINMAPTTAGSKTGSVTILHKTDPTNDEDRTVVLPLFGTALPNVLPTPAEALFSPVPVIFSDTVVDTPSTVRVLTMQNLGQQFLNISGFTLDTGFSQTNNCGAGLASGASCQINLTMLPTATGPLTGNLIVTHDGLGDEVIPLSGLGVSADAVEFIAPLTVVMTDTLPDEETYTIFSIQGDNLSPITLTTLPVDAGGMTFTFSASPTGPFTTMTTFDLPANGFLYIRAAYTGNTVGAITQNVTVASTTPAQAETITITTNVIEPPVFLWEDIFVDMTSFGGLDWSGAGWGTTSALPADPALNFFMWERLPILAPEASIIRLVSPTGTMHLSRRWEMPPERLAYNYTIDLGTTIVERSKASGSPYWGMILAWGEVVANDAVVSQPAVGVNAAIGDMFITLKNDADTTAFLSVAGPGSIVELRTNATAPGYHPPESRQTLYIKNVVDRVVELHRPLDITALVNNTTSDDGTASDPSSLQLLVGSLLASNAARGATSIVVQNATGFAVGDWIELSTSELPKPAGNQFSAVWLDAVLSDIAQADNPEYFGTIGINTELNQITAISGTTFTLREPLRKNKLTAWQGAVVKINPIKSMEVRGGRFEGAVGATNTSAEAWEHQYIWARYCVDSLFRNGKFDTLGRALNVRRIGQCVRLDTGWNSLVTGNEIARGGSIDAGEGYGVSMRLGERNSVASYNTITNCRHGVEFWSSGGGCVAEFNTLINGTSSDIDTHGSWNIDVTIRNNYFTNDGALKSPDIGTDGWTDAIRVGNNKFLFDDGIDVLNNVVEDYNGNAFAMVPASMNVLVDGLTVTNVRRVLDLGQNSRHKKAVAKNLTMRNITVETVTHRIIHMYGDGLVSFNFDNILLEDWTIGENVAGLVVDGTSNTDPKDTSTYIQRFRNLTLRNMRFLNMETPTDLAYVLDIRFGSTLLLDNIEIDGGLRGITLRTVTGVTGDVTITSLDTLHAFNEGGSNTGVTGVLNIDWVPSSTPTITKASTGLTVNVT